MIARWSALLPLFATAAMLASQALMRSLPAGEQANVTATAPMPILLPHLPERRDLTGSYELDPDGSTLHFEVDGSFRSGSAHGVAPTGTLQFDEHGLVQQLRLSIPMHRIKELDSAPDRLAAWHVLGADSQGSLQFTGTAAERRQIHVPGVFENAIRGRLQLGNTTRHVTMHFWQISITQDTVRLQGAGSMMSGELGLPRRYILGLISEEFRLGLGLDLLFRRRTS
jgi:hypothetical protein